jgi:putative (di)nucleoside polyphosphate hydrolase
MTPEEIARLPYRPCVGVMLVNPAREVFVGQRIDSALAAWQMPQGGVEKGEAPEAAALRELREETGVRSDLVSVLAESADWLPYELPHELVPKLWKGRFRGQKQKWFLMRFHGQDNDIDIDTDHREFSEWRWLPAEKLVQNIVPFKRDVYAAVMAEFDGKF